jgi:Protein of unknown function (DUF2281)/Bacterial antitoxin of ParD toxin-antitoxin type II system and RHH
MQIMIDLPDHLLAYIQAQVTSGRYATPSDYIQALIETDRARTVSLGPSPYRQAGSMQGMFTMADDFNTPLEDLKDYR